MLYPHKILPASILCFCLVSPAAFAFERVVVFGDSLSDNGNTAARTFGFSPGPEPYFDGRFSNGPVWTEHLISALGLEATSKNYAYGGAQAATGQTIYTEGFLSVGIPNTGWDTGVDEGSQFDLFSADLTPSDDLSDDLFLIGGGAVNYFAQGETTAAPAGDLIQLMQDLYDLGARNFMVSNLPDLGLTPDGLTDDPAEPDPTSAELSSYTMAFNAELLLQIDALRSNNNYDGISVYELDLFGFMNEVIANPIGNITNVTDAAILEIGAPADPADPFYDTYLFFDETHPSAFAHQELGDFAFQTLQAIPEPNSIALLAAAMILNVSCTRQRRRQGKGGRF